MDEVLELLQRLDARIATIEQQLSHSTLDATLCKQFYSVAEVAELTQQYGTKKCKPFTVRLACNDGRIPEAEKSSSGTWQIPLEAVRRILVDGIPPEKRRQN